MPTLSFILSGLLVGAGSIYLYLSQTDKIEKTKQKIAESNKVTYLAKKSSLTLSSVKNIDTNNSINVMATTGDKLSNFISKDEKVKNKQLSLLDRCQEEVQKIISSGNTPNEMAISACKKLKDKKFEFYGLSSSGVSIPEKSILKKDSLIQTKLQEKIKFASFNEKIIDKKIKQFEKKKYIETKVSSIKSPDIKKVKDKIFSQKISKYNLLISKAKKEKSFYLSYKKSLLSNISSLESEISTLSQNTNNNNHSRGGFGMDMMDAMTDTMKNSLKLLNRKKSSLDSKRKTLASVEEKIASFDAKIEEYTKKLNNLKGKKDD